MSSSKESVSFSVSILSAALSVPVQAEECSTLISAHAQVRMEKPHSASTFSIKTVESFTITAQCFSLALLVSCVDW